MKNIFCLLLLTFSIYSFSQNETYTGPSEKELESIAKDIKKQDSIDIENAKFRYVEFFDSVFPYRVADENFKVYIKLAGKDDYGYKIWLKYEYFDIIGKEEYMYLEDNIKRIYKNKSTILFSVNCNNGTYIAYEANEYDENGNLLKNKKYDKTIEKNIVPDTIIDYSLRFYCPKE